MRIGRPPMPLEPRFFDRIVPEPNTGCWLWTGAVDKDGYGQIKEHGKQVKAHRVSWKIHHGELPEFSVVCHQCDTPSCVNPAHLFLGTHADNMKDRDAKGRTSLCGARGDANGRRTRPDLIKRGFDCPASLLSVEQVDEIMRRIADGASVLKIAEEHGVSDATVRRSIKRRRRGAIRASVQAQ